MNLIRPSNHLLLTIVISVLKITFGPKIILAIAPCWPVTVLFPDQAVSHDLISSMIQHDHQRRPTSKEVLQHPFFWTKEKQLMFFQVSLHTLLHFVLGNGVFSIQCIYARLSGQSVGYDISKHWPFIIGEATKNNSDDTFVTWETLLVNSIWFSYLNVLLML